MKKFLFKLARSRSMGYLVGKTVQHLPFIIPARSLYKSKEIYACNHPVPSYKFHTLIIPRKRIPNVLQLDSRSFSQIVNVAHILSQGIDTPLLLCVNGGVRQDVKQLHFHLISTADGSKYTAFGCQCTMFENDEVTICGNGKFFSVSAKDVNIDADTAMQALFHATIDFIENVLNDSNAGGVGYSLLVHKRIGSDTFDPRIFIDFNTEITYPYNISQE